MSDAILPEDLNNLQNIQVVVEEIIDENKNNDPEEDIMDESTAEQFEDLQSKSKTTSQEIAEASYEQGIKHLAAAIASKFRDDKSLGTTEMKSKIPAQMYATGLNKGGLLQPTEK